jgi:hypothetical protein
MIWKNFILQNLFLQNFNYSCQFLSTLKCDVTQKNGTVSIFPKRHNFNWNWIGIKMKWSYQKRNIFYFKNWKTQKGFIRWNKKYFFFRIQSDHFILILFQFQLKLCFFEKLKRFEFFGGCHILKPMDTKDLYYKALYCHTDTVIITFILTL